MKSNIYFKHACLYKVALLVALTFVAAWFILFSQLSLGNGNTDSTLAFHALRTGRVNADGSELPAFACPQSVAFPTLPRENKKSALPVENQKLSPAELYNRLIWQRYVPWSEPRKLISYEH